MFEEKKIFLLLVFVRFLGLCLSSEAERRLLDDLLGEYQKFERPVADETLPVNLELSLSLQQIIDLDERNQLLKTNIWLNYVWSDANLMWNESYYEGIKDVRIPPGLLWTPDLLMYNSAAQEFDTTYKTNIVVDSSGGCNYIPPGIFQSTCQIDITWFPFDDQDCLLKFGSWTYDSAALNLTLKTDPVDISTYQTNGEWELIGVPAQRYERLYECCPHPYLDVIFKIQIRRRTLYYFSNLILPCVLIASMAVFGFCCPPESGEKITLEITILMSLTFFMNVVSDMQPPSSETPLIGTYFSCIMIMVASSVVCTILVLNYHHRLASNHRMPFWFRAIFLQWLPWLLRMSRPGAKITRKTIYLQNKMRELEMGDKNSKSLLANVLDLEGDFILAPNSHPFEATEATEAGYGTACPPLPPLPPTYVPHNESALSLSASSSWESSIEEHFGIGFIRPIDHPTSAAQPKNFGARSSIPISPSRVVDPVESELHNILDEIRVITNKIRDEDKCSVLENEWKFAAMVLDRVCLIAFTLFTVILSAAVSLAAPHVVVW